MSGKQFRSIDRVLGKFFVVLLGRFPFVSRMAQRIGEVGPWTSGIRWEGVDFVDWATDDQRSDDALDKAASFFTYLLAGRSPVPLAPSKEG